MIQCPECGATNFRRDDKDPRKHLLQCFHLQNGADSDIRSAANRVGGEYATRVNNMLDQIGKGE